MGRTGRTRHKFRNKLFRRSRSIRREQVSRVRVERSETQVEKGTNETRQRDKNRRSVGRSVGGDGEVCKKKSSICRNIYMWGVRNGNGMGMDMSNRARETVVERIV